LRGAYSEITAAGSDVVAIGTGNAMYANAFIADEKIPYTVLIDGDGTAAKAASVKGGLSVLLKLATPSVLKAGKRARAAGHKQGKTGVYEHLDDDVGDHAPLADLLAALTR
jgi:hypothetical protein